MRNRQTRRVSLCILVIVFVAAFVLMAGCAHQAKPSVIPNWPGLSASQTPTTPNGIALERQTFTPVHQLEVSISDTSKCPPAPWGKVKAIYRATPWGKIKPIYRTAAANRATTKTGAIEPKRQREQSPSSDTITSWSQLRAAYEAARTDSTSRPTRGATWGEIKDRYRYTR